MNIDFSDQIEFDPFWKDSKHMWCVAGFAIICTI